MPMDTSFVSALKALNEISKQHGCKFVVKESQAPYNTNCYGWWIVTEKPHNLSFHYKTLTLLTDDVVSGNFLIKFKEIFDHEGI